MRKSCTIKWSHVPTAHWIKSYLAITAKKTEMTRCFNGPVCVSVRCMHFMITTHRYQVLCISTELTSQPKIRRTPGTEFRSVERVNEVTKYQAFALKTQSEKKLLHFLWFVDLLSFGVSARSLEPNFNISTVLMRICHTQNSHSFSIIMDHLENEQKLMMSDRSTQI